MPLGCFIFNFILFCRILCQFRQKGRNRYSKSFVFNRKYVKMSCQSTLSCIYLFQDSHDNDSDSDIEIKDDSERITNLYQKLKAAATVDVEDVEDKKEIQKEINPVYFEFEINKSSYLIPSGLEIEYENIIKTLVSKGYLDKDYLRCPEFFSSAPEVDVGFSTIFL